MPACIVCVAVADGPGSKAQLGLATEVCLLQYGPSMLIRRFRSSRSSTRSGTARGASQSFLSVVSVGVPLLVLAQALTSCGDDDGGGGACQPNTVRACAVVGNTCDDAVQTCNADGTAFSECACGGGSGGAGGSAGAGGSGGGNAGAAGAGGNVAGPALYPDDSRPIGAPCEVDADCPTAPDGTQPLICIPSTSTDVFGTTGGPQGGYCSIPCDGAVAGGSNDCRALDALSFCFPGANHCVGVCLAGSDTPICSEGARAQACYDLGIETNPGIGACLPVCHNDAACGEGLYCDFGFDGGLGLCTPVATPPIGTGGVGAPCTRANQDADCLSGICLEFNDPDSGVTEAFCSATCTLGILPGCGFGNDAAEGTREAACLLPQLSNGGAGDAGLCLELCDVDTDCEQPGFVCVQDDLSPATQAQLGRLGECVPPLLLGGGVGGIDAGVDGGN
jgi:hypothetical protein